MTARKQVKRHHKQEQQAREQSWERAQLRKRIAAVVLSAGAIVGGLALAISLGPWSGSGGVADANLPAVSISIGDNFFQPDSFTISAAQTYRLKVWNQGQSIHDVWFAGSDNQSSTGDDVRSDPIAPGERATVKIEYDNPGTYFFVCTFHAGQGGKLIVE